MKLTKSELLVRIMQAIELQGNVQSGTTGRREVGYKPALKIAMTECAILSAIWEDEGLLRLSNALKELRDDLILEDVQVYFAELTFQIGQLIETHPSVAHLTRKRKV
jgi:hypothetical protein